MVDITGFILSSIFIVVIISLLFKILDHFLKNGFKKTEKKTEEKKTPAKPETVLTPTNQQTEVKPTMKIYNSELADDLNKILKDSETEDSVRLKIENHVHKESNVAKYIKSKNYQGFDFGGAETNDEEVEKPLSFTIDDYKRIMALSNIDEKK